MFQQTLNPAGNLWLTVFIAMVPFVALLYMLAALRLTAWLATIIGGLVTILLGVLVWHAPVGDTLKSYLYGGFTGFWAIDEKPTGSKDPYALRRAALGAIRLLVENQHRINLTRLFDSHAQAFKAGGDIHRQTAALTDERRQSTIPDATLRSGMQHATRNGRRSA